MSRIVSFISRKGGTGKTTNAIQLATSLDKLGYKVCLFETDTNYTLSTLREIELSKRKDKDEVFFPIFKSSDDTILKDIDQLPDTIDFIIVDSAGKTTTEQIKLLAIRSSMIVIPTSLTQNDLLVAYQTVEDLKPAQELNPQMKLLVLPNRIHSATKIETVKEALQMLSTDITDVYAPAKGSISHFSTIAPTDEYDELAKNILEKING